MQAQWYFALVNGPGDTGGLAVFDPSYARNDYTVVAFALAQEEGQFATLDITIKNPRRPLLGDDRIWLWMSYEGHNTGGPVPLFFGRLVGIPTSIFDERVTLQFVARPIDYGSQKESVLNALAVLPNYDKVFIDEQHRDDLDAVLDAYPRRLHSNRVTHELSTSHVLIGEDGTIELQAGDVSQLLYRGFAIEFGQIPLTRLEMEAVFNWDQIANGSAGIDITNHIVGNWPNEGGIAAQGSITSFTLQKDDWPKPGASLGNGWVVSDDSTCIALYDLQPASKSTDVTVQIDWGSWADLGGNTGSTTTNTSTSDQDLKEVPPGSIELPPVITDHTVEARYSDPDPIAGGPQRLASYNTSTEWTTSVIPLHHLKPTLKVTFEANRQRAETVRFTMTAEIQPILTLPGEDEVERVKLNSVRLNNPIDDEGGTGTDAPMVDARRRSYVVTSRGQESLQYLVALAVAKLLRRSRAVNVTHQLTTEAALDLIPDLTLRKNVRAHDPRLPDGEALGKLVAYRFALEAGVLDCRVTIGCAPGRGGAVAETAGTPTYAEANVMGPDVQEFTGRMLVLNTEVAYSPARFLPDDDGVDFLTELTAADIIATALTVQNPPATQRAALENGVGNVIGLIGGIGPFLIGKSQGEEVVAARARIVERILEETPTAARFTLKDMTGAFEQAQTITVSELKVPTMINLEASTAS